MSYDPTDPTGHGLLSTFHKGCRCPWCKSAARERACVCELCTQLRARSIYVEYPGTQERRLK